MANHCTIILCAILSLLATKGGAQTQPQFEVTSVRQNLSQTAPSNISTSIPDRFVATNVPVRFLILNAYELLDHQLADAPEWTYEKSFDIAGTYPGDRQPPTHEIHRMLQQLLADRFALKAHRENRELPAYDLVIARKDAPLGQQIHKSATNCEAWIADGRPKKTDGASSPASPSGARPMCATIATRKWLTGGARTMQDLAATLQSMTGRPVVDKTGLSGPYDIDLQWAAMDLRADEAANATPSDGPSLFKALQEQLGLKLVSHREKFEVVVIDHIELPSPN